MPDDKPKNIDYSYTEIEDPSSIDEQLVMPSSIENIDFSIHDYFQKELSISANTNQGFKKVPIFWVTPERSFARKFRDLRDDNGMVVYPLMTLERTNINKDRAKRGKYYAALDSIRSLSAGNLTITRRLNQNETNKFATAAAYRKSALNDPNRKRNNKKVVYETITMPYPVYLDMDYELTIYTEYQQQMNEIVTAVVAGTNPSNYFLVSRNGHTYEALVQPDFAFDNTSTLEEGERLYKTKVTAKVLAYTIGAGENEALPKILKEQNVVEVRIGRERVLFGEDNPNNDDGFFRG
jgi:hypothetical protein